MNLAEQVAERLTAIEKQIATLNAEKAALRGAASGKTWVKPKTGKAGKKTAGKKRTVSKAAKAKQGKAAKAKWADVTRLHKAGKIAKPDLASWAAYYKKNPSDAKK